MAKEKKVQIKLDPFTEWAHRTGRIFMAIFTIYMVAIPLILCAVYGCMPPLSRFCPARLPS